MSTLFFWGLLLWTLALFVCAVSARTVSAEHSFMYGTGTDPKVLGPARYLSIQAVDAHGENFTESPGKDVFELAMWIDVNGQRMTVNTELHDRGDGTYACIFFFNLSADRFIIEVRSGGKHISNSPMEFGAVQIEPCYCPLAEEDFLRHYQCGPTDEQILRDLEPWPQSYDNFAEEIDDLDNGKNCIVHYVIKNNRIYGEAYGPYQGFKRMMDDMLLSLARKVWIPDTEFVVNLGDWPLAHHENAKYPVFSWCGSTNTTDVVMPTYKMTEATVFGKDLENVPDVDAKAFEQGGPWNRKRPVLHWRGRDSNDYRLEFVKHNNHSRDVFDIAISKNMFNYFPDDEARQHDFETRKIVDKVERTKFLKFWLNKYLLSIDGTVAAYRMPALIAGNSVVFKQDSVYYEHFYHHMRPYEHYIPVKRDLSDAREQVLWAREHDDEVRQIAKNAREVAREHLYPPKVFCYYYQLLSEWSRRAAYPIKSKGLEEAVQPDPPARAGCRCPLPGEKRAFEEDTTGKRKKGKKKKRRVEKDEL
eukprot:Rmarinus@m.19832